MAASDYNNLVQQLYIANFGRPADFTGLSNFSAALNAANAPSTIEGLVAAYQTNPAVNALVNSFGNSAESLALYVGGTFSFVNAIYNNVFGRQADFSGLLFWAHAIDSGALNKGAAALNIMAGALTNTSAQGLIDAAVVQNKVIVASNFTNSLDTTAKILAYDGNDAVATARTMLAQVNNTTNTSDFQSTVGSTVSNLVVNHEAAQNAGSTFTLTTAIDAFTGKSGNDTFQALTGTLTQFDTLDGGAGNDVLNIASTGAFTVPLNATVSNIETVNINGASSVTVDTTASGSNWSGVTVLNATNTAAAATVTAASTTAIAVTDSDVAASAITVNGGSTVAVTATGSTTGTITLGGSNASAGAVTISSTAQKLGSYNPGGTITVTGGTTVSVTSTTVGAGLSADGTETSTQGAVNVTGNASTTSVTVIQSGRVAASEKQDAADNTNNTVAAVKGNSNGAVTINDANANSTTAAATIAAVTLQNYADSTISSNALATLTLSSTGVNTAGIAGTYNKTGTLSLTDGLTTPTVTALTLNLGGGYIGAITDSSDKFTTVNAVMTANTKLDNFTNSKLKTLAISGTGVLTLVNALSAGITLTSVTVSGAAGFSGDLSGTGVTTFTAANTSANNTVTLKATTQAYTGGSGNDKVTIKADATKTITGGAGTDTLVLGTTSAAIDGATFTLANTGTNVTGFEVLQTVRITGTVDMSKIGGSVFNKIQIGNDTASDSTTFSNITVGTVLELLNATTAVTYQTSDTNGADDAVTVTLTGVAPSYGTGTKGYTTTALTLQDANGVGIGSVNIVTDASVGGGIHNITTLTDSALSHLAITGTGALGIGAATTSATTFTVSDNNTSTGTSSIETLNAVSLANISYSGTHAFGISTLENNAVTTLIITNANTGSTGVLSVGTTDFTNNSLTSLTLNGSIKLNGNFGSSSDATFSGATDNQNVSITADGGGVKTITLGNGDNTIITGSGADVITLGSGANTVTGGTGGDKITFAAHTGVDVVKYTSSGQTTSGTVTSGSTALTAANGYDIYTGLQAGDEIDLQRLTDSAYTSGALGTTLNGATGGTIVIVRGTYVASTGIFTTSSTGTDSILQWDSNGSVSGGNTETIVLVGFVNSASTTSVDGLITLA